MVAEIFPLTVFTYPLKDKIDPLKLAPEETNLTSKIPLIELVYKVEYCPVARVFELAYPDELSIFVFNVTVAALSPA